MQGFRLTRRRLLVAAGSGVLGLTVLNTVTGCTEEKPAEPGASTGTGDWKRVDLSFVSAYLLVRGGEVAVVDLGTAGSAESVGAALTAAGAGWDR